MRPQSPTDTLSPTSSNPSPRHPQRPPPPSLFIGPPSHNASNISLPSLHQTNTNLSTTKATSQANAPPLRSRSNRVTDSGPSTALPLGRSSQQQQQQRQNQSEGDRTDALWAEMQATLAEVELSAARGTHFFGPEHSTALEALRASQIALAQAWARSEANEIVDHPGENEDADGQGVRPTSAGDGKEKKKGAGLEEETEGDILLARKRREANDRYFGRVSSGVLDVVGKLEEVAVAMGKVEKESRELWSESESMESGSLKEQLFHISANTVTALNFLSCRYAIWSSQPVDVVIYQKLSGFYVFELETIDAIILDVYEFLLSGTFADFLAIKCTLDTTQQLFAPKNSLSVIDMETSTEPGQQSSDKSMPEGSSAKSGAKTSLLQLYQDFVHVKVGDNAQDFGIHKGLLCEASSYFKGALSRGFQEAQEKIVHLREDDVETFQRFHLWLYTGCVLDSDESLESLSPRPLIDLYIWADLRGIPKLQDLVSDMLQTSLLATLQIDAKPLESALIQLVYNRTLKTSSLRKLWTFYYSNLDPQRFKDVIAEDAAADDLPREFRMIFYYR
ncbi:hypothetical protein MMC15_000435 [Xylographa vitiligo]|nr:hypothetical protein [Xylographa vitiligo]